MNKAIFSCPLCKDKREFFFVMNVINKNWKKIKEKKFAYYRCDNCGFWILQPRLTSSEKKTIYKGNYYSNLSTPVENIFAKFFFRMKLFSSYGEFVMQNSGKKNLLDVGCGTGDFLLEMKNQGYTVNGIDPYPDAVKKSQFKIGKQNVKLGSIESLKKTTKQYGAITMWHVLEHTEDPLGDMKILLSKLERGGKILIEIPNSDSFNMHLFKKQYAWHMVPEHHYYFNKKSISYLIKKVDAKVVKMYYPPRALMNFSYSINNLLPRDNSTSMILFFLSIPFSIILTIVFSYFQKGEVIRVIIAKK